MKTLLFNNGNKIILGTAREICSLYNNFYNKGVAYPVFADAPKFNMERCYGLNLVYFDEYTEETFDIPRMTVMSADSVVDIISTSNCIM